MKPSSLLLALLVTTLPAQAAITVSSVADYTIGSFSDSVTYPPGYLGTNNISALVTPARHENGAFINVSRPLQAITGDYSVIGQALANGNAAGNIAVQASFLAPSGGYIDTLHAQTKWSDTVVNQSGGNQAYTFDFHIAPGGILAGAGSQSQASYKIEIMLDNNLIWDSSASLQVGSPLNNSGTTTLSSTYFGDSSYGGGYGLYGYTFGGYNGQLNLGPLANNASFTLSYLMEVSVSGFLAETDAYAAFGDPLSLSGSGGMIGQVTPVPEPETWAMLLAGLGLVGWTARRRK